MTPRALTAVTALVVAAVAVAAPAQELFSVTANGGGNTLTVADSDIIDLIEDLIETEGAFEQFNGIDTNASLTYGGVPDTFLFDVSGDGRTVTLSFPITGFSRTFTGDDADDVEEQIEEFFEEDGAEEYARLIEELNRRSLVSVVDGNPFSSTAIFSRSTFQNFAVGQSGPAWANPNYMEYRGGGGGYGFFSISPNFYFDLAPDLEGENGEDRDVDGTSGGISGSGGYMFNRVVGLSINGSYQYVDLEGTEVFHSAISLGIPINLVAEDVVGFQLTPFITSGLGGSTDAAAGGAFYGLGLAGNLRLSLADRVVFNFGNQLVYYHGYDITYDDYEFATDLDQTVFTTGLLTTVFVDRPGGNFFVDAGLTYTTYLEDAAVDDWITPELGVGYRFSGNSRVRASYRALLSEEYDASGVSVNLVFTF